jgi:hypothetical protein
LFIVYADFDSSSFGEVRTFYEIKANIKNEIFLLSLHMSFAKYTEKCHCHVEGVDLVVNVNECVL